MNIEQEFKAEAAKVTEKIKKQLKIASDAIAAAEKLSEESGIPFRSNVSPLGMPYVPNLFHEKWKHELIKHFETDDLDGSEEMRELVYDETSARVYNHNCGDDIYGWEHSAVC